MTAVTWGLGMNRNEKRGLGNQLKKPTQSSEADPGLAQHSARSTQHLEVVIEELVLHGFAPGDRHRIAGEVEKELARLFSERGLPSSLTESNEIERIDGGAFELSLNDKPGTIGTRVAKVVFEGLSR